MGTWAYTAVGFAYLSSLLDFAIFYKSENYRLRMKLRGGRGGDSEAKDEGTLAELGKSFP
jgi:hypothetical protein